MWNLINWQFKTVILVLLILCFCLLLSPRIPAQESLPQILSGNCGHSCMENPALIDHIKSVLVKPSGSLPRLKNPENIDRQRGQSGQVDSILQYYHHKVSSAKQREILKLCFKRNGFFIEAGAWDGEQLSNTLYLEVSSLDALIVLKPTGLGAKII